MMRTQSVWISLGQLGAAVVLLAAVGCAGMLEPRHPPARVTDTQREQAAVANLQAQLQRLEYRVESLEETQEKLFENVTAGQQSARARHDRLQQDVKEVEQAVARSERARAQDKQEILEVVKSTLHARPVAPQVEHGREHTVRQGETLSEIARAYGSRVDAIVQANNLEDAHRLRIGQTLFIPE